MASPKAAWPIFPHGWEGLFLSSMTSATRFIASGYRPFRDFRFRGLHPRSRDSPSLRLLIRPVLAPLLRAHCKFAEFPPETIFTIGPKMESIVSAILESSDMLFVSGITPLRQARLAPMPMKRMFGSFRMVRMVFSSAFGIIPSLRSPSSTISMISWMRLAFCAALESLRITLSSELKLICV